MWGLHLIYRHTCNLPGVLTVHLENIVTESSMCWNSMKQSNNKPRIAVIITSTNRRNRMNKLRAHMFGRSSSNIQGHTSTCHLHKLTACSLVFYVFFFIRYLVHQGFHNENGQSMQDMCVNVNLNSILVKCIFVQMAYCARLKNGMHAVNLRFSSLVFHMTTLVFMYNPHTHTHRLFLETIYAHRWSNTWSIFTVLDMSIAPLRNIIPYNKQLCFLKKMAN